MKLRNKKTGEIKEVLISSYPIRGLWELSEMDEREETGYKTLATYNTLAELNKEWEDYEEPHYTYWIDTREERIVQADLPIIDNCFEYVRELGLAFETKEEAEKAVEKLKAWKRLKDKGFKFRGYTGWDYGENVDIQTNLTTDDLRSQQEAIIKDLNLLFGGNKDEVVVKENK